MAAPAASTALPRGDGVIGTQTVHNGANFSFPARFSKAGEMARAGCTLFPQGVMSSHQAGVSRSWQPLGAGGGGQLSSQH